MTRTRRQTRLIGVMFLIFLIGLAAGVWAQVQPPPPAKPLIPLIGSVSRAGILVVSAEENQAFDPNLENVSLSFPGVDNPVKPQLITPDGRTLMAQIPNRAKSGQIIIKNNPPAQPTPQAGEKPAPGTPGTPPKEPVKKAPPGAGKTPATARTQPAAGAGTAAAVKGPYLVSLVIMQDPWANVGSWYMFILIALLGVFLLLLPLINKILKKAFPESFQGFSLVAALSFNPKVLARADNPPGDDKPPEYVSSLSRLIAFIGVIVLVPWCVAVLTLSIYFYAHNGEPPNLSGLLNFFLAQVAFFFPYLASKLAEVIKK